MLNQMIRQIIIQRDAFKCMEDFFEKESSCPNYS